MTTRRKMTLVLRGVELYLVPNTLGCASVCWERPKVTVVSTANRPVIVVRLPDDLGGATIDVHEDNLVSSVPQMPRKPAAKPRPHLTGAEEVPLW